jgi:putative transposase
MYKHNNLHTESLRDDDYAAEGDFFVTINAENNNTLFAEIVNGKTHLLPQGKMVRNLLLEMEKHFLNLTVEAFVIMPNHIHAIVNLAAIPPENLIVQGISRFEMSFGLMVGRLNPFLLKGSIFHAISWFKASSLIELRKTGNDDFAWKSGYFDFVIDNKTSYNNIKNYIQQDPENWIDDIDHPENNFRSIIY